MIKIWGMIKKASEKKPQACMYSATILPEVHDILTQIAPQYEYIDLNASMSVNNKSECIFFFLFIFLCYVILLFFYFCFFVLFYFIFI